MGRTLLSPDTKRRLVEAWSTGSSHRQAAQHAGIAYSTLERWLREGRRQRQTSSPKKMYKLLVAYEAARESCLDKLDAVEWNIAIDEKQPAGSRLRACETIRNRILYQGRKPTVRVEHTGTVEHQHDGEVTTLVVDNKPITDAQVRNLTTGQIAELLASITKVTGGEEPAEA